MATETARRGARLTHDDWMALAEQEYRRLHDLLVTLDADDWSRPTDCSEWDVRQVVAHLVGAAEGTASVREGVRQLRRGPRLRPGAPSVDGINALQVQERAHVAPERLVSELDDAGVRGVRARRRLPAPVRALRVPFGPPLGVRSVGYLMDCIYTRDAWMHRADLARATGRRLVLTADHDGRLVDDVVHEWAAVHDQPFQLTLTGPAGGSWSRGTGGEPLELDAIDFCRGVSGRAAGEGLLAHAVPF